MYALESLQVITNRKRVLLSRENQIIIPIVKCSDDSVLAGVHRLKDASVVTVLKVLYGRDNYNSRTTDKYPKIYAKCPPIQPTGQTKRPSEERGGILQSPSRKTSKRHITKTVIQAKVSTDLPTSL